MSSTNGSEARARVGFCFTAYLVAGVFDAELGVVWPSMRADLHQPLSALGLLLIYSTAGFLVMNVVLGPVLAALGLRRMMVLGSFGYALGMVLMALGSWPVVIAGGVLWGVAGGLVAGAINVYSTLRMSGGTMQALHGTWGVGSLLGPLLITGLLVSHQSWRFGLLAVAVLQLGIAAWALTGPTWPTLSQPRGQPRERLRLSLPLVLGILAFFLYTGAEWSAGQWSFTVLTQDRGFPTATAGVLVSLYWTGLTVGRLSGGALGLRVATPALLLGGAGLTVVAAALFWLVPAWSAVSLPLLGLGLAPIFPALMTLTSRRVPESGVGAAVGFQSAGSGAGSSVLPAGVGVLLQRYGLSLLGPCVFAFAVATAAVSVLLELRPGALRPAGREGRSN